MVAVRRIAYVYHTRNVSVVNLQIEQFKLKSIILKFRGTASSSSRVKFDGQSIGDPLRPEIYILAGAWAC